MAKRPRLLNPEGIQKRIKEGRGQGTGAGYIPWLTIQDVPSIGRSSRIKGWKTNRVHHFLSDLERKYFFLLEWSPLVSDIREQYPLLPLQETLDIAKKYGIRHPTVPGTNQSTVMTTDFRVTLSEGVKVTEQARTLKYAAHLETLRTIEKFQIEQDYWKARDIDWAIATEHQIPEILVENVQKIHNHFNLADRFPSGNFSVNDISKIVNLLSSRVLEVDDCLSKIASGCDKELGLKSNTSLAVAYHLIATRQWKIDMNIPIIPRGKLNLLLVNLQEHYLVLRDAV